MLGCLDFAVDMLPTDQPRYLMGVCKPDDLVEAVRRGCDMFDCVPDALGAHPGGVHRRGPLNLRNARFAEDREPIEPGSVPGLLEVRAGLVHHLVKSGEILRDADDRS